MSRVSCTGSRVSWARGGKFSYFPFAVVELDTFGLYNVKRKSGFVGVAIYETDRANNRILQADPGL